MRRPLFKLGSGLMLSAALLTSGCNDDDDDNVISSFGSTASAFGLTTLSDALSQTGLADLLETGGPYTVFGPTNAAFDALPVGGMVGDLTDAELRALLEYHIVEQDVTLADFTAGAELTSLAGGTLFLSEVDGQLFVNETAVQNSNIPTLNGRIFSIDGVLTPPVSLEQTLSDRGFTTLLTALDAGDLLDDINGAGPFTLLAPTNEAFDALPDGVLDDLLLPKNQEQLANVLRYHLLGSQVSAGQGIAEGDARTVDDRVVVFRSGGDTTTGASGLQVNYQDIRQLNVPATNGVVHSLDSVLSVPKTVGDATLAAGASDLWVGLNLGGLLDTLNDSGADFTLFVPTNDAVRALDPDFLVSLAQPKNADDLQNLLLYHVTDEVNAAVDVLSASALTTLEGTDVVIDGALGTVNGTPIFFPDLPASNGVLHALSGVLIPESVVPSETLAIGDEGQGGATIDEALFVLNQAVADLTATPSFQEQVAARLGSSASGGVFAFRAADVFGAETPVWLDGNGNSATWTAFDGLASDAISPSSNAGIAGASLRAFGDLEAGVQAGVTAAEAPQVGLAVAVRGSEVDVDLLGLVSAQNELLAPTQVESSVDADGVIETFALWSLAGESIDALQLRAELGQLAELEALQIEVY